MEHHLDFLNPNEMETEFDSTDLNECLEYYETNGDIEPLRSAIAHNARQYKKAKEELIFIREAMQVSGKMTFYINKITNIFNILRK